MLDNLFQTVLDTTTTSSGTTTVNLTGGDFVICTLTAVALGVIIAAAFRFRHKMTKGFTVTLALLPAVVELVIMLVNGNLGTGIAVMGAFSLVRFRSVPGSAKDICAIFIAMAAGLAAATGYIAVAFVFTIFICLLNVLYTMIPFDKNASDEKVLKVTIPEGLDYTNVFDDLFEKYLTSVSLDSVKTTNMGSLFKLDYTIKAKSLEDEKKLIDEIRERNGNLEISLLRRQFDFREEL
ncbi:MAG: DUF4956 domain-containing protein [Ruminococcus sp.]|nr:DUF4956 domain-containing protein [Ruminococcus sp.]